MIDVKTTTTQPERILTKATSQRQLRDEFNETTREFEWVTYERQQMHTAVNTIRARASLPPVHLDAIRDAETSTNGHIDYVRKYALHCARLTPA